MTNLLLIPDPSKQSSASKVRQLTIYEVAEIRKLRGGSSPISFTKSLVFVNLQRHEQQIRRTGQRCHDRGRAGSRNSGCASGSYSVVLSESRRIRIAARIQRVRSHICSAVRPTDNTIRLYRTRTLARTVCGQFLCATVCG